METTSGLVMVDHSIARAALSALSNIVLAWATRANFAPSKGIRELSYTQMRVTTVTCSHKSSLKANDCDAERVPAALLGDAFFEKIRPAIAGAGTLGSELAFTSHTNGGIHGRSIDRRARAR